MKKIISIILAAIIVFLPVSLGMPNIIINTEAAEDDYKCGDNATWSLDTVSGVLYIEGTGKTYNYVTEEAPRRKYNKYITSIVIEEGITYIGVGAFSVLNNVVSLSLSDTVEEINADADFHSLETLSVSENSNLKHISSISFASKSKWYASIPDNSPVYIGPLLYAYKGTAPENTVVEIKNGTKAVNSDAFVGIANIKDITFPDSLDYIGESAFEGTGWYDSLPDGTVYAGNVLYSYKGTMQLDDSDLVIKNGIKSVTDRAFYDNQIISSVTIPSSLEIVGIRAFYGCKNIGKITFAENSNLRIISDGAFGYANIKAINLPESLEYIGNLAFVRTNLTSVYIPERVSVLDGAFSEISSMKRFEVSPDNSYYCSDDDGILFNKDKTILHYFPAQISCYEYRISDSVTYIGDYAFSFCRVKKLFFGNNVRATGKHIFYQCYIRSVILNDTLPELSNNMFHGDWGTYYLTVPESVKTIGNGSLGFHMDYVYFTGKDVVFADKKWTSSQKTKFFCYEDSTVYEYAQANCEKLSAIVLDDDNIGDYSEYEYAVNKFQSLSSARKSSVAYWNACAVIDNVPANISKEYQDEIDALTVIINSAFDSMKVVWSDYSAVDEAIERANSVDRKMFTDESLARLDAAVNSVKRYCDVADVDLINEYVNNIDDSIARLDEKTGDYSELYEVLSDAENINRSLYTKDSLSRLDEAVSTAKNADKTEEQSIINSYAQAVKDALNALEYVSADFSKLDGILAQAKSINRDLYTSESLAELDDVLAAVDFNLTIDKQSQVDEWAKAIENAIENLEYLPADYSAVEAEIRKYQNLDRRYYSEISLIGLDTVINQVEYGLNITEQPRVDAYAKSISDAISSLKHASIVLRHEPCGVIVSATTKEIKPDTILAVEEVDPTTYEGTNFAVGGSIRSLHFYDINLVCETVVVQPDGTVTVKIKLADGVDPAKCKVYHVTEDIVNPLVRFASTIDGNYIVFETDHFSEFAVIEVETVVDSIEVTGLPDTTVYGIGEQLDFGGMKVIAHYSDGTSKEITDYNVGMVTLNTIGTQKVTVYYTYGNITKTAEFEITVTADKCSADITENGRLVDRINKKLGIF